MTLATNIFLKGPAVKSSLLSSAISIFAVVATTANGFAAPTDTNKPHLQPNAPRTVVIKETETPPIIRAGLLQSTLILLPAEEKVATVFGGDTVDWVFDGGHVASRFISIKPKLANSTTDVHIISDHGNEYTLQLHEISSDGDLHFDSKVFITPGDQSGKEKLAQMPVFVPAAELDKVKQEAAAAKAAAASQEKTATTEAEQYRSQYPGQLHFDYAWDKKKKPPLSACSRYGAMTNSHICAAYSRRPRRSTRPRTARVRSSTSISRTASTPFRKQSWWAISPSGNKRSSSTAKGKASSHA